MWDQLNWASSAGCGGCAGRGEPPAGLVLGNNLVIAPTAPRVTDAVPPTTLRKQSTETHYIIPKRCTPHFLRLGRLAHYSAPLTDKKK